LQQFDGVVSRWPEQKDVVEQAQGFAIEILLTQGKPAQAVDALRQYRQNRGPKADALVVSATLQVRDRLIALEWELPVQQELQEWRAAYAQFAAAALESASTLNADGQYPYRQMLAEAWAENGATDKALAAFEELSKLQPSDARNLQGIARCHWLDKRHAEAVALYQRVLDGLARPEDSQEWWRTQFLLAECIYDASQGKAELLGRLSIRIKQLRAQDRQFGGHAAAFDRLAGQVDAATGRASTRPR
jgi:tetratricopeptide (TPR) repeat protein